MEQGLCKTVIATSKVNWATTSHCLLKPQALTQVELAWSEGVSERDAMLVMPVLTYPLHS